MRTAVTAFALLGLLCGSAAAADMGSAGPMRGVPVVDAARAELVAVQTEIRQALVDASVAPAVQDEVYESLITFVRVYAQMVRSGDEDVQRLSLEDYLQLKVALRLQEASLSIAESERVLTLVHNWVGLELSASAEPAVPSPAVRLDREVRR